MEPTGRLWIRKDSDLRLCAAYERPSNAAWSPISVGRPASNAIGCYSFRTKQTQTNSKPIK